MAPRRPGRPRAAEPGVPLTVWVPASAHTWLHQAAQARDLSISAYVRALILRTTAKS